MHIVDSSPRPGREEEGHVCINVKCVDIWIIIIPNINYELCKECGGCVRGLSHVFRDA